MRGIFHLQLSEHSWENNIGGEHHNGVVDDGSGKRDLNEPRKLVCDVEIKSSQGTENITHVPISAWSISAMA